MNNFNFSNHDYGVFSALNDLFEAVVSQLITTVLECPIGVEAPDIDIYICRQ